MVIELATRDIDLEIAYNVRHLGGYPAGKGKQTTPDAIRSASLHRLMRNGVGRLRDLGVTVVVDLRSTAERQREATPDLAYAGIENVHAPVFEADGSPTGMSQEFPGFAKVYEQILERGAKAYRTLFETLARSDGGVLFHCAAGKDRTGVAAALLLQLAGVSNQDIVADYKRSAELLLPMVPQWEPEWKARGIPEERVRQLLASNPEDMEATLRFIGMRWGHAEGYLEAIGVSRSDISALRARLATSAPA